MQSDPSKQGKPRKRRMNLELYYWEQVGNRFYFRYTPFAFILTVAFGLIIIAGLVIFMIIDSREQPKIDTKSTMPSPSPYPSYPVIQQAPPPTPPARVNKQPQIAMPTPQIQNKNTNARAVPQHTPTPQPFTPPP